MTSGPIQNSMKTKHTDVTDASSSWILQLSKPLCHFCRQDKQILVKTSLYPQLGQAAVSKKYATILQK